MNLLTHHRHRRLIFTRTLIMLMLPVFFSLPGFSKAIPAQDLTDEDIVVIVPKDSNIDTLSQTDLRAIFGMRSRIWPQGGAIRVFVMEDDDPVHAIFTKQVLHTFPFNLRRIWDRRVYSGTGQSPEVVKSEAEMREQISGSENSIGYIRRNRLDSGVKVVKIK